MRIRRFLHLILGVTALCLVWQIVTTWNRTPPVIHSAPGPGSEEDGALIALPARPARVGRHLAKQIADKDLFAPERQPPEVASQSSTPAEPEPVPAPSHLTLVGVFLAPGREEAFLADSSQANKVTRVQKGEQIDRYRLTKVTSSHVTLSLGPGAGEVDLALQLLNSQNAKKVPRILPTKSQAQPRAGQTNGKQASREAKESAPDVSVEVRQQIQEMQRRLRQIRRQAAGKNTTPAGR